MTTTKERFQLSKLKTTNWLINAPALLIWSVGLGAVSLYFARITYGIELFISYFQNPLIALMNILPVTLLTAVFWLASNRVWVGVLGSGLVVLPLTLINFFKLLLRSDPLLATDVFYAAEAFSAGSKFDIHISSGMVLTLICFVAAVLLSAYFLKARLPRRLPRFAALGAVLILCAVLFKTAYRSYPIYLATENLDVKMESTTISPWSQKDQYATRGFLYPLLFSARDLSDSMPEGYDKGAVESALAELPTAGIPADKRVNVISVMLEAYSDFSKLGLEFETDPYSFWHELEKESISGELVTNVFAGTTVDTERAFLTGAVNLYEYRGAADSFVRYFAAEGYYTEFCHPCYEWFYNRLNVMDYLGFESSYFYENRYTTPAEQGLLADELFFPDLITLYNEALSRGKEHYFNFSLTYQNHGPYDDSRSLYDESYALTPDTMSEKGRTILNNYLGGIARTDSALESFVSYFREDERPMVLVFFGDHKPWLGDGDYVYEELGISFSGDEGFYTRYGTPYVIWANAAAKETLGADFAGEGESISPCFLMSLLFDEAGWEGDWFMQASRELRQMTPIINSATAKTFENGRLTDAAERSQEVSDAIERYKQFAYYRRRDTLPFS